MEADEPLNKRRKTSHGEQHEELDNPEAANGHASGHSLKRAASEELNGPSKRIKEENLRSDGAAMSSKAPGVDTNGTNPLDNGAVNALPTPEETAPLVDATDATKEDPPLSKSQQKKLRKKQEWEDKRGERKVVRKEKIVAKRERRKAEKQQQIEDNGGQPLPPPVKKAKQQMSVTLPVTFLIDCDFDDLMRDNERISLAAQITRSYSDNKNSMFRAHLTICSFGGKLRERFDKILTHYKSWRGVRFLDCHFVEASEKAKEWMLDEENGGKLAGNFSKLVDSGDEDGQAKLKKQGEIVYLTSEAEETLTELKPFSTYIIGGLVDKNREKGVCYKRATRRGIRTARLPIGDFMDMQSRKVLATNHVNEIMLKWLDCGDWGEAFMKVIPKRKGGKLKTDNGQEAEQGDAVEAVVDEGADEEATDEEMDKDVSGQLARHEALVADGA